MTNGSHEPNGLVELIHKDYTEPNTKATTVELYEGLNAKSQNCWPSLKYDFMSINDKFSKPWNHFSLAWAAAPKLVFGRPKLSKDMAWETQANVGSRP